MSSKRVQIVVRERGEAKRHFMAHGAQYDRDQVESAVRHLLERGGEFRLLPVRKESANGAT